MRKICVYIGSRANYSSIKSAMIAIKEHPSLELQVIVGASAVLNRYGAVVDLIEKEIHESTKKMEKKTKKQKAKNMRIFRKIMRDKNTMNDYAFYEKMEPENQKKIIKELREINKITRISSSETSV
jgi:hypothetical protein